MAQSKASKRDQIRTKLMNLGSNLPLQEFLDKASTISADVSLALDGIYCGWEGRVDEPLGDFGYIHFGWYTTGTVKRVEFCYVS